MTLIARIEQIIYNGPMEYAYDFRWVVREGDQIVNAGTSSSEGWAQSDCHNGIDRDIVVDFSILPEIQNHPGVEVIGAFVSMTGHGVPWPQDVQAFFEEKEEKQNEPK